MTMPAGSKGMALGFPNGSRNFDAKRNRVCFWGYDSTIEISFFVEADTLRLFDPEMGADEAGVLAAFDAARERIHEVADKVYGRSHKKTFAHLLAAPDF